MKNILAALGSKFSAAGKAVKVFVVANTKACIIGGCVAAVGVAGIGTVVAINVNNHNETVVVAEETRETQQETNDGSKVSLATVATTQEETTTEEETQEEIQEETQVPVKELVDVIPIEELEIVEDTSTTQMGDSVEVSEPEPEASTSVYEVNNLVYGIDVSHWQGNIDWSQVAAAGYKFAIIKVAGRSIGSDGNLYVDDYYEKNLQGAIANGIQVGVYFFSQALTVDEAREEASLILQKIQGYQITYPVVFDWESASGYRVNGKLNSAQLTEICEAFCDVVAKNGYQPMIYFNKNDWNNSVDSARLTSKYKSWLAWYWNDYYYTGRLWQNGDDIPNVPFSYQMWQYTSTGSVPGIKGSVDMNIAFFSYDNYNINNLQEAQIKTSKDSITVFKGGGICTVKRG